MKIHTPIFILGLLTFVTPFLGFTAMWEAVIIAAYGIAIMIISSTIRPLRDSGLESDSEFVAEIEEEITIEEETNPTYEDLTEEVQNSVGKDVESSDEVESEETEANDEEKKA